MLNLSWSSACENEEYSYVKFKIKWWPQITPCLKETSSRKEHEPGFMSQKIKLPDGLLSIPPPIKMLKKALGLHSWLCRVLKCLNKFLTLFCLWRSREVLLWLNDIVSITGIADLTHICILYVSRYVHNVQTRMWYEWMSYSCLPDRVSMPCSPHQRT